MFLKMLCKVVGLIKFIGNLSKSIHCVIHQFTYLLSQLHRALLPPWRGISYFSDIQMAGVI